MAGINDKISLNVGGVRFETTRQSLCHEGDSMLAAMFKMDSNFSKPGVQEDGAYFLDRDPEVFKVILRYLRTGQLFTQEFSSDFLKRLRVEAVYFGLQGLRDKIEVAVVMQSSPDDLVEIDARGTRIKTTRRVITKGKYWKWAPSVQTFSSLFDPQSPKFLKAEDDGSYKIDCDSRYLEWLLAVFQCESAESVDRVFLEFCDKYGDDMMWQWYDEFFNKYQTIEMKLNLSITTKAKS